MTKPTKEEAFRKWAAHNHCGRRGGHVATEWTTHGLLDLLAVCGVFREEEEDDTMLAEKTRLDAMNYHAIQREAVCLGWDAPGRGIIPEMRRLNDAIKEIGWAVSQNRCLSSAAVTSAVVEMAGQLADAKTEIDTLTDRINIMTEERHRGANKN